MTKPEIEQVKIVIIGGGPAGKEAAFAARKQDPSCSIILLSGEPYYPYYRPMLTQYLSEELNEKRFYLTNSHSYAEQNIEVHLNDPVISIMAEQKEVITQSNQRYSYDRLILAMGSSNFVPFPNACKKEGVFSIRTYDDARQVKEYMNKAKKAVIIGGGLLGLEAAWELRLKGLDVTVVELMDRILPLQLDSMSSAHLKNIIESKEIHLILGKAVKQILGEEKVSGIELEDGSCFPCDMVLFSVGIRPNIQLAKDLNLETHRGIIVNEAMETSIPTIYAAGDVAEFQGKVAGIWMPALLQGRVAGANAAGGSTLYPPPTPSTILSAFETRIFSVGDVGHVHPEKSYECLTIDNPEKMIHHQLFFLNDQLVGGILTGDIRHSTKLMKEIDNKIAMKEAKNLFTV